MFKSLTCAAFAAVSLSVFAQSIYSRPHSQDEVYYSDIALMANPPVVPAPSLSYEDLQRNVRLQSNEWEGSDKYQLYKMLGDATGDIDYDLCKALYHVRNDADVARHDVLAQAVSGEEQLMMLPGNGTFQAQTPSSNVMAQVNTGGFAEIGNRPMRMVLEQPRDNPNITYEDAADILEHAMNSSEANDFDAWFWHYASDADRDTLVHIVKFDNWLKDRPVYVSTITPDITPTFAAAPPAFPTIPFPDGK